MYSWLLLACVCLVPTKPEEGTALPDTEVTNGGEPFLWRLETQPQHIL